MCQCSQNYVKTSPVCALNQRTANNLLMHLTKISTFRTPDALRSTELQPKLSKVIASLTLILTGINLPILLQWDGTRYWSKGLILCNLSINNTLRWRLTNWGRDKMGAISQRTRSSAFFNENRCIPIEISLTFFLRVQLTIFQQWFR